MTVCKGAHVDELRLGGRSRGARHLWVQRLCTRSCYQTVVEVEDGGVSLKKSFEVVSLASEGCYCLLDWTGTRSGKVGRGGEGGSPDDVMAEAAGRTTVKGSPAGQQMLIQW